MAFENWLLRTRIRELTFENLFLRTHFRELTLKNSLSRTCFRELAFKNSLLRTRFRELAFKNSLLELTLENLLLRTCFGEHARSHMVPTVFIILFCSFQCNATRDALAKALFCRTVATIVRRANSLKRPFGNMGSESTESTHHEVKTS
jgi:ribosomal protein S14